MVLIVATLLADARWNIAAWPFVTMDACCWKAPPPSDGRTTNE
jgi:hypothetical protein